LTRVAVLGLGVTGDAVVRWARALGDEVVLIDDRPGSVADERLATARALGVELQATPAGAALDAFVAGLDLVVPSPGVPERHALLVAAARAGVPVRGEVDIAAELLAARGRAFVAITGTNGKTTVTELTVAMLEASGVPAVAAGNIGAPLLDAARDDDAPAGSADRRVVVAEVSSFQLATTTGAFRPRAAAILNLADDHLDWHRTFAAYAAAKARIFSAQAPDDLVVYNADDPVVAGLVADAPGRTRAFSVVDGAAAGYRVVATATGRVLVAADGTELAAVDDLRATAPHDLANALAAAALALEVGGTPAGVGAAFRVFARGPHRLHEVATIDGVRYVDDSKATNVHAALAAVRTFPRVVLIAGGRNKGLDLSGLRAASDRVVAVVAIGEAADEVEDAFRGVKPVLRATSMVEAVRAARDAATAGDVVLLSPACASFDWYRSYGERGDDFARVVAALRETAR
jgi:UDP-N-acetylmuramoylalanine--D-glutamate ligase